jgi:hypothetical protein
MLEKSKKHRITFKKSVNHENSKTRQIDKKFFWQKQKSMDFMMILNDKPNCQVSKILMNSQTFHVKTLRLTL